MILRVLRLPFLLLAPCLFLSLGCADDLHVHDPRPTPKDHADFHAGKVQQFVNAKQPMESILHGEICLELDPDRPAMVELLLKTYREWGLTGHGLQEFQALQSGHPDSAWIAYGLGRLHMERRQYDEAARWFRKAMELDPENPRFLPFLANARIDAGEEEEGLKLLRQLADESPDHLQHRWTLGRALVRTGHAEEAREVLESLEQELPRPDPNVSAALAQALLQLGQYPEAESRIRKIQEQAPHSPELRYQLSRIYLRTGNLSGLDEQILGLKQLYGLAERPEAPPEPSTQPTDS